MTLVISAFQGNIMAPHDINQGENYRKEELLNSAWNMLNVKKFQIMITNGQQKDFPISRLNNLRAETLSYSFCHVSLSRGPVLESIQ